MTNEFKNVELIELHDSNVKIHPRTYSDALAGWSEYSTKEQYVLGGEEIERLANYFGIQAETLTAMAGDPPKRYKNEIKYQEFNIVRKDTKDIGSGHTTIEGGGSHKIGELWAKVIGERMLEIKFTSLFGGESEDEDEDQEMVYVTYSGSYSVWWSPEKA